MRFLQREIREDGRGLYAHYGGIRLRPHFPRETKFKLGEKIAMAHSYADYSLSDNARVFKDIDYYELWASLPKDLMVRKAHQRAYKSQLSG